MAYPTKPVTSSFTFDGVDEQGDAITIGEARDSEHVQERVYSGCVELVNFYIDTDRNAVSRPGYSKVHAANITSSWSNGKETYCVSNGALSTFDGVNLTPLGNSPALQPNVEFLQVNDHVLFSDNRVIGYIKDRVVTSISAPLENIDLLDLETWVKLTYPAGADADASNFEIDAFKITTFAGRCLCFYNGVVYIAVDNFLFCTKAFDFEHMDIRYNVVAGFSAPITLVKQVNDGLWVGTEKEVCFLEGGRIASQDETTLSVTKGFTQKRILPYGCHYASGQHVLADNIGVLKTAFPAVLFVTSDGIYAGVEGGNYKDLTENRVDIPSIDFALDSSPSYVSLIGKTWLYVVCIGKQRTVAVNLDNGLHSIFENYLFDSFFEQPSRDEKFGDCFGTSSTGIYLLGGESDNGTAIDAHAKTGSVDFGVRQLKQCPDAYLHARTAGAMLLEVTVDEERTASSLPLLSSSGSVNKARQFRAKPPRGLIGNNWQYKISNVAGAALTLFSLHITPNISKRSV